MTRYPELVGLRHWLVPLGEWFAADEWPTDRIVAHHVVTDDGEPTTVALGECPDCTVRFEAWLRGEPVEGWPSGSNG